MAKTDITLFEQLIQHKELHFLKTFIKSFLWFSLRLQMLILYSRWSCCWRHWEIHYWEFASLDIANAPIRQASSSSFLFLTHTHTSPSASGSLICLLAQHLIKSVLPVLSGAKRGARPASVATLTQGRQPEQTRSARNAWEVRHTHSC